MTTFTPRFAKPLLGGAVRVVTLALFLVTVGASAALAQVKAYVLNENDNAVAVVDPATNTVIKTIPVGIHPNKIVVTPNGAFASVANFAGNNVSVIDTATNSVVATAPTGAGPFGVAFTPDGAFTYVVNFFSNSVSVISTATKTVTANFVVGTGPDGIAFVKQRSPQDQIAALIAQVEALISGGTLTQNKGDALINKLNQVSAKLGNNQTGAACNQMGAFVNQVNAFVNGGSLTQAQGQALIDAANAIRTNLGC